MPNRIIKETICTSDTIDRLDWFDEVCFYRLTVNVDDYGRFDARPAILKSRLFPLKADVTDEMITGALLRLEEAELVCIYTVDGKPYLFLPSWERHQTIRNHKSKYPAPESNCKQLQAIEINCNQLQADASNCARNPIQYESNPNPDTNTSRADEPPTTKTTTRRFEPPSVEEVRGYCAERKNKVDPERFVNYYSANGWKVGKNSMKDWRAAIRTWEGNQQAGSSGPTGKRVGFQSYGQDDAKPFDPESNWLLAEARALHTAT
jgi:hypothetical protein